MEYIVVLNADTKAHSLIEDSHYFIEKFSSYEDAKAEAEQWKQNGDCRDYSIFVKSDQ